MNEAPGALVRFEFTSGLLRGSHLGLYPRCVIHRSPIQVETVPLAAIAALRVAFDRNRRQLSWGVILIVLALLLLIIAGPLGSFAAGAAAEMAATGAQGVARALYSMFRFIEGIASVLPAFALAFALGGAALAALGWRGSTTLTLCLAGSERVYSVRGRDTLLLDFADAVSERLMALAR